MTADPRVTAAWRTLRTLRADPARIEAIRPKLEEIAGILLPIDTDTLTEAQLAVYAATGYKLLALANIVELVDEPEVASVRRMLGELLAPSEVQ